VERAIDDGVEPHLGREGETAADVAFASPKHGRVDGDDDGFVRGSGRSLQHLLDQSSVPPGVDLKPLAATRNRGDFFDRSCAQRRQRVR